MLLGKIHKFFTRYEKSLPILLIVVFSILFFLTRLPGLANDVINPDGVLWHARSEQFVVGLKHQQFEKTYQHYQPGVTLMWIVGSSVEIFKQISGIKSYNSETYQTFDLVAKLTLVAVQFVLSLLIVFNLSRIVGFYKSLLIVAIFTFEPFFVGNSRLLHLDVLSTLLMMLAIILAYLNLETPKFLKSVIVGFLLAISFLTKSVCIGALVFVIFYTFFYLFLKDRKKEIFPLISTIFLSFLFFLFLLFPALWVNPRYYLLEMIFGESERVGIREGHKQIVLGSNVMNGGYIFYPLVFLLKLSPFLILSILFSIYSKLKLVFKANPKNISFKNNLFSFGTYFAFFNIGYILLIFFATKKIDRYLIVSFPFFAYMSFVGYKSVVNIFKKENLRRRFYMLIFILILVFVIKPLVSIFPWYFTYTNPLFGSTSNANKIIGQKSFGVGIPDLKKLIINKYSRSYGDRLPNLAFYDTKPMKEIYPNSRVFDYRVYGPSSYDLLVLGINEEMPDKVLKNRAYIFEKDTSMWINGLEYWTIYVRKALP